MNLSADDFLIKQKIKDILEKKSELKEISFIESLEVFGKDEKGYLSILSNLFSFLNYQVEEKIFPFRKEVILENRELEELIINITKIAGFQKKLGIFFVYQKNRLASFQLRNLIKKLQGSPFGSFNFILVLAEKKEKSFLTFIFPFFTGKEIELRKLNVDLNNIYRTDIDVLSALFLERDDYTEIEVLRIWKEAFSVEKVNDKFFDQYFLIFNKLWKEIFYQIKEKENSLDISKHIAHQILNRLMFCFFIEKKENWLGEKNFIKLLVKEYKKLKQERKLSDNSFYNLFLKPLFLEAFNKKFINKSYLSEEINNIFSTAPYLNGGLFEENEYDKFNIQINDSLLIDEVLNSFLFSYNFTIVENAPLEKEVAINPELIGRVYEKFVNLETNPQIKEKYEKEQNSKGIVYTHEREIDFMCKKSLIEYLKINLPELSLEQIYDFVYSNLDEFKGEYLNHEIVLKIKKILDELKILDPAVGSGSFLVGFLNLLVSLHKKIQKFYPDISFTDFGLKKKIIKENLYGVDVMDWAVKIAELRLWLSLIIESNLTKEQLQIKPLLPNLDFKLRQGDSLIQKIANFDLTSFDSQLKRDFRNLIDIKLKYYEGDKKFSYEEIEAQKRRIIIDFIERKIIEKIQQKQQILRLNTSKIEQQTFLEVNKQLTIQDKFKDLEKNQIEKIEKEIEELKEIKTRLQEKKQLPFFWEIDFVEVFYSKENKKGFDIVIGNPPYVRQEDIAPPLLSSDKFSSQEWLEKKREYKKKLQEMVERFYGKEFIPEGRSDLYVYFYFKSLSLLDKNGIFCFICSNSWLDVDYGKTLQEFLLRRTKILGIYDNQVQRSFSQADINTIIIFTSAPSKDQKSNFSHIAKFVAFKKPYEEVLKKDILLKIDKMSALYINRPIFELVKNRYEDDLVKIFPISQNDLYKDGLLKEEKEGQTQVFEKYEGNKWGGKYLRAPEIYFKILEKGKLKKLPEIAIIEGYIHGFNVGRNYPKAFFIENLEQAKTVYLDENSYGVVQYGVKNKGNSRTLADLLFPRMIGNRFLVLVNYGKVFGQKFYKIILKKDYKHLKEILGVFLNSTFQLLQNELFMLSPWGQGALSVNSNDIKTINVIVDLIIDQKMWGNFSKRTISAIFEELGFDPHKFIREQEPNPLPDRKALDDIVFDALGLTQEERKEVYWAVAELVKNRLEKAKKV